MSVIISGNIYAGAVAHKWSGALVSCKKDGDKTIVTFEVGSPVSEKTVDEILEAQSEYVVYKAVMDEIERLESEVTQRRLRDAYADPTWINAQEAKIAVERAKL